MVQPFFPESRFIPLSFPEGVNTHSYCHHRYAAPSQGLPYRRTLPNCNVLERLLKVSLLMLIVATNRIKQLKSQSFGFSH